MMKKILFLLLVSLILATPVFAGFINGGFEDGNFNGWTQNGGYWYGLIGSYSYSGDPGKSAIVSPGLDPVVSGLSGPVPLPEVYSGSYSGRVNDGDSFYQGWGGYHFSTITQSVVWNDPNIYFAWAAVLEEPGHPHDYEPHFYLTLDDVTTGTNLYSVLYAADTIPGGLLNIAGGWKYTDWQIVNLDTSAVIGDTLTLTLLASDCGYGGHSGYVYLDGFGATTPPPGVPEPATLLLLGSGLIGVGFATKKRFKK